MFYPISLSVCVCIVPRLLLTFWLIFKISDCREECHGGHIGGNVIKNFFVINRFNYFYTKWFCYIASDLPSLHKVILLYCEWFLVLSNNIKHQIIKNKIVYQFTRLLVVFQGKTWNKMKICLKDLMNHQKLSTCQKKQ